MKKYLISFALLTGLCQADTLFSNLGHTSYDSGKSQYCIWLKEDTKDIKKITGEECTLHSGVKNEFQQVSDDIFYDYSSTQLPIIDQNRIKSSTLTAELMPDSLYTNSFTVSVRVSKESDILSGESFLLKILGQEHDIHSHHYDYLINHVRVEVRGYGSCIIKYKIIYHYEDEIINE